MSRILVFNRASVNISLYNVLALVALSVSGTGVTLAGGSASAAAVLRSSGGSATVANGVATGRIVQPASGSAETTSSASGVARLVGRVEGLTVTLAQGMVSARVVARAGGVALTDITATAQATSVSRASALTLTSSSSSATEQSVLSRSGSALSTVSGLATAQTVTRRSGLGVVTSSGSAAGQMGSIGGSDMPITGWKARAFKRGKLLVPEVDLTLGPVAEGVTGAGDFAALFGRKWALALDKDGVLHLLRESAGSWGEVAPLSAFPVLPSTARHIGMAFDQSGRPVVVWESGGAVFVRQYDANAAGYLIRGPFAGSDPVIFNDAVLLRQSASSDVVVLHLSADRLSLRARVQNAQFLTDSQLYALPAVSTLDAVVLRSSQYDVRGEANGVPFSLLSAPYTVTNNDVLSVAGFTVPVSGALEPLVLSINALDTVSSAAFSIPNAGDVYDLVLLRSPPTDAVSVAAFSTPATGELAALVLVYTLPTDAVSVAAFGTPATGDLVVVVTQIFLPTDAVSTAAFSVPTAGLLEVI